MKLDKNDLEIVRILQKDARAALSEIAEKVGISRPTVKAKIEALQKAGVIKRFTIALDRSAIVKNILVFLLIKSSGEVIKKLNKIGEIQEIYQLMGSSIIIKAVVKDIAALQSLIEKMSAIGVQDIEYYVVSRIAKEEYNAEIGPEIGITLDCDFCRNVIAGEIFKYRAYNKERYFCCPTCLKKFKERYSMLKKGRD